MAPGGVYIADQGNNVVRYIRYDQTMYTAAGGGANAGPCTVTAPCTDNTVALPYPYSVAVDAGDNFFLNVNNGGSSALPMEDTTSEFAPGNLSYLDVGHGATWTYPIAVDANDNLYYTRGISSPGGYSGCTIVAQNQAFSSHQSGANFWRVAGTNVCGFSGDGGFATGAEISTLVQGFAWDTAGDSTHQLGQQPHPPHRRAHRHHPHHRRRWIVSLLRRWRPGQRGLPQDAQGHRGRFVRQRVCHQRGRPDGKYQHFGGARDRHQGLPELRGPGSHHFFRAPNQPGSNVGNSDLNFTRVAFTSGNTGDFAIDPNTTSCNFARPLQSGRNCFIGIVFTPAAVGARSAILTLLDGPVTGSNVIQLNGTSALPATAILSKTTLAFPLQATGTTSASQSFTLSNTGGQTLTINSYTFTGATPTNFAQTHSCPATLTINTGCTITVTFSPTTAGSYTATLSIGTSIGAAAVTLSGTGAAPATVTLSPTSLTFPSQTAGTSSTPKTIIWNNTGGMPLTINSITFTGTNPAYFSQVTGCLALSGQPGPWGCGIDVTFKPAAAGSASATLSISTSIGTKTVPLSGTGTAGSAESGPH